MARSRSAILSRLAAAALLCLAPAGCEDRRAGRLPPPPDADEVDRLRSLPYVGFSPAPPTRAAAVSC